jgi:undecaprenyl-diphosphatase
VSLLDAIVLGIVQGLTEFLPVSSTAHLILASRALGLQQRPEELTALIAVIQLGTLAAVLAYYARELSGIAVALTRPRAPESRDPLRLLGFMIAGTLPIVIVGLLLRKHIEGPWTKDLRLIAASLAFWSLALAAAEFLGRKSRDFAAARAADAWIIGVFQVFALFPGASRSGTSFTGGLFAGLNREASARLSFLLSIPAVAAAGLLELREIAPTLKGEGLLSVVVAAAVAGVVGYASIWGLIRFLRTRSTLPFVIYRLALAALLLAMVLSGRWAAR